MPLCRIVAFFAALLAVPLASCGGGGGGGGGAELVRVRVSAMTGLEPGTITSSSHPTLFVLDPRVSQATLTFDNPDIPLKDDPTPATWRPVLAPGLTAPVPGTITLTIVPVAGAVLDYGRITFTTSALFASNPSSLRLLTSDDGFATALRIVLTDIERTTSVPLAVAPSGSPFSFRWLAADDGGDNGGGSAGFSTADVVVRD